MDPAYVEKVEAELDQFVERRAREAKDAKRVQELWAESERKERERRREHNGWLWISYHEHLARFHQDLAHEHEDKANHVRELLGEYGFLTEHKQKEEPMNEKNGHAGRMAS